MSLEDDDEETLSQVLLVNQQYFQLPSTSITAHHATTSGTDSQRLGLELDDDYVEDLASDDGRKFLGEIYFESRLTSPVQGTRQMKYNNSFSESHVTYIMLANQCQRCAVLYLTDTTPKSNS